MNRNTPARISTGYINTVFDPVPGQFVNNNTGVPAYAGLIGQKYRFDKRDLGRKWYTTSSAAPGSDVEIQYVELDVASPVNPARGVLCFWKDKANKIVSTDDTQGYEFAGVCLLHSGSLSGLVSGTDRRFIYIAKVGVVPMKFKSSTTKATPAVGDLAVTVSGNSGLADVIADATAETYGLENTNEKLGRLESAVTSQIATVSLHIVD